MIMCVACFMHASVSDSLFSAGAQGAALPKDYVSQSSSAATLRQKTRVGDNPVATQNDIYNPKLTFRCRCVTMDICPVRRNLPGPYPPSLTSLLTSTP